MREQLVNSGQAAVVTTFGTSPEDKQAQEVLRREKFLKGETSEPLPDPDFSLTGKITQVKRTAGNTKQATYTFRLTLTNLRSGLEAWTKTVDMTKLGNKNAVGF
jgi:PBP1b-binding outer membrane lipoprotein LpoB